MPTVAAPSCESASGAASRSAAGLCLISGAYRTDGGRRARLQQNVDVARETSGGKIEANIREHALDERSAETLTGRLHNRRPFRLPPFEIQPIVLILGRYRPGYHHLSVVIGQRAIFGEIGREFVQRQRKILSVLRIEDDIDAAYRRAVAERLNLQAGDVGQIDAAPA